MSINLKPHSLECGRSVRVLDFGSQENQRFSDKRISNGKKFNKSCSNSTLHLGSNTLTSNSVI